MLEGEAAEEGGEGLVVGLDERGEEALLEARERVALEEPLGLVELALEADLVGDLRADGAVGTRQEGLARLGVLVGSDRLDLDELGGAVGFAAEVGKLLGRILELVVEGALQVHVDQVLALLLLLRRRVEVHLARLHQVLDVVRDLVRRGDLLRELALVEHAPAAEEAEDEDVALRGGRSTRRAEEVCILIGWRA